MKNVNSKLLQEAIEFEARCRRMGWETVPGNDVGVPFFIPTGRFRQKPKLQVVKAEIRNEPVELVR